MRKALFIFRRDLRLRDNTGLIRALRDSEEVVPAFIFDPRQTGRHPYKSDNALQFLVTSLAGLDRELRTKGSHLYLFQGRAENVVYALLRSEGLDAVYVNRDYTPFSRRRDAAIGDACREKNAAFVVSGDALLNEPVAVAKADGTPYKMFTPFFRAARALAVRPPRENALTNYHARKIDSEAGEPVYARVLPRRNDRLFRTGDGPRPCASWAKRAVSRITRGRETSPPSTGRPGSPRTPSSARSPSGNSTGP